MDNAEKELYLSALLDNNPTSEEQKKKAEILLESDADFQETYRAMAMVRSALRTTSTQRTQTTPAATRAAIMQSLQQEQQPLQIVKETGKSQQSTRAPLFSRRMVAMGIAAVLAYMVFSLLLQPSTPPATGIAYLHIEEDNYREQAWHNFAAITKKKFSLHKATSSFTELEKFFRKHGVNYALIPPEFPAELLGGVISEHNGALMAHIVFRHDSTLIYMFQAPRSAFTSHTMEVENTVLHIVDNGAWYWEESQYNGTLAIWEHNNTLCAFVAKLPPKSFQSLLQSKG